MVMDFAVIGGNLEIRQVGGARVIGGRFPYNSLAVRADRGSVRKERFLPGSLGYSIREPTRKIDLLVGHDFGKPIASRQSGTLTISETAEAVTFEATLPVDELTPSWVVDVEKAIANGTMTGLSPGFRVPPANVVPGAERLTPEPGNPGVMIRDISQAVLREFSVVTAGSYEEAIVDLRAEDVNAVILIPRSAHLWL